jgi:hypothetical protein
MERKCIFFRRYFNAEARRAQRFAEFDFLCGPRRPQRLSVKVFGHWVAAWPRRVHPWLKRWVVLIFVRLILQLSHVTDKEWWLIAK